MDTNIHDAVYGCLMGGAIGDALGAPTEGKLPHEIHQQFGRVTDLLAHKATGGGGGAGFATDDTTLRHCFCLAIVRKGGRITPDDAAVVWRERLRREWIAGPDRVALIKLQAGVSPWHSGEGSIPSACPAMAIAPVGIINAGDPAQAYQDGFAIAGINGEGFDRDASAALAAAYAAAFAPGAGVEDVLAAASVPTDTLAGRAIGMTLHLARQCPDVASFTDRWYAEQINWWSRPGRWSVERYPMGTAIESVPLALALLQLTGGDVEACMVEAANFGRDSDTVASIVGALAGAMRGASAIRPAWIETVEAVNRPRLAEIDDEGAEPTFRSMADRLVDALARQHQATLARAGQLAAILGV